MNLPVAALIWLIIVPMLLKIGLGSLRQIGGRWRGILVIVGVNWLVKPFSIALLGLLFIGYLLFCPGCRPDSWITSAVVGPFKVMPGSGFS